MQIANSIIGSSSPVLSKELDLYVRFFFEKINVRTICNMVVGSDGNVLDNSKRDHMGGVPSELNLYPTQLTKDLSTPTSKETMPLI